MEKEGKSKTFSHSRLWLYENCPEAYKVKYIDKMFPDIPKSIELFLGSMVHESLEWLYHRAKQDDSVELDDLISHFLNNWKNNFSNDIRMRNGGTEQRYATKGVTFLVNYYQKHKPFKDNTIEIEKRILFPLDESDNYFIQGYVDRIVFNEEANEYEVHDYKTNERMKRQDQLDADRQLAFYHIGLQELFGKQISVKLVWHFLAHNASIQSRRTQEQLEKLKAETLALVKKIETTTEWRSCGKSWCDWCAYKKANNITTATVANKNVPLDFANNSLVNYLNK